MGTKNNPGRFDAFDKAEPDEPMFVLLGRDPLAPLLIELWAHARHRSGEDVEKVLEAKSCANACTHWLLKKGKHPATEHAETLRALIDVANRCLNKLYDDCPEEVEHYLSHAADGLQSAAGYVENFERSVLVEKT